MPADLDLGDLSKENAKLIKGNRALRNIWTSLSEKDKQIIIKASVEGSKEIEALLKSMGELSKKQAEIAARFAAIGEAAKKMWSSANDISNYTREYNKYAVTLEKIGTSSQLGAGGLKVMRSELSLLKAEMGEFYQVSNKLFQQGFDSKKIESTFKDLRKAFGNQAMQMANELANVLQKVPTLRGNMNRSAGRGEFTNMMATGTYDSYLNLKGGGFFGGKLHETSAAGKENLAKDVQSAIEITKDVLASGVPAQLVVATQSLKELQSIGKGIYGLSIAIGALGIGKGIGSAIGSAAGEAIGAGATGAGIGAFLKGGIKQVGKKVFSRAALNGVGRVAGAVAGSPLTAIAGVLAIANEIAGHRARDKGDYKWAEDNTITGWLEKKTRNFDTPENNPNELQTKKLTIARDKYLEIESFIKRNTEYSQKQKNVGFGGMSLAGLRGNTKEIEAGSKYVEASIESYQKLTVSYLEDKKARVNENISKIKSQKNITENDKELLFSLEEQLLMIDEGFLDVVRSKLETVGELIKIKFQETAKQGGTKYIDLVFAKLASIETQAAVSKAPRALEGGMFDAFQARKTKRIEEATRIESGKKTALEEAYTQAYKLTGDDLVKAFEAIIPLEKEHADAIQATTDAMSDMSAFDYVKNNLEIINSLFMTQAEQANLLSGAWHDLEGPMTKQLENAKQQQQNAQNAFNDVQNLSPENPLYQQKQAELEKAKIKTITFEFEMIKAKKDSLMLEHEVRSSIMKEQGDFLAEMGGHFSDVLSMKASAFEEDRKSIEHLKDFISTANLSDIRKEQAINELKRKEMELARNTIGFQKSVYEKFVGFAFGALSDKGYKTGRMDASVMMGYQNTRVKIKGTSNYISGENPGMNRDDWSLQNALGGTKSGVESSIGANSTPEEKMETSTEIYKTATDVFKEAVDKFAGEGGGISGSGLTGLKGKQFNPSVSKGSVLDKFLNSAFGGGQGPIGGGSSGGPAGGANVMAEGVKKGMEAWGKVGGMSFDKAKVELRGGNGSLMLAASQFKEETFENIKNRQSFQDSRSKADKEEALKAIDEKKASTDKKYEEAKKQSELQKYMISGQDFTKEEKSKKLEAEEKRMKSLKEDVDAYKSSLDAKKIKIEANYEEEKKKIGEDRKTASDYLNNERSTAYGGVGEIFKNAREKDRSDASLGIKGTRLTEGVGFGGTDGGRFPNARRMADYDIRAPFGGTDGGRFPNARRMGGSNGINTYEQAKIVIEMNHSAKKVFNAQEEWLNRGPGR